MAKILLRIHNFLEHLSVSEGVQDKIRLWVCKSCEIIEYLFSVPFNEKNVSVIKFSLRPPCDVLLHVTCSERCAYRRCRSFKLMRILCTQDVLLQNIGYHPGDKVDASIWISLRAEHITTLFVTLATIHILCVHLANSWLQRIDGVYSWHEIGDDPIYKDRRQA